MSRPRDDGCSLWTTADLRSAVEVSLARLPAVVSVMSLDDADGWLGRGHVVLNADQMWMANMRSAVVNMGHMVIALVRDMLGVRRRDRRDLRDVGHVVRLRVVTNVSGASGRHNSEEDNKELHGGFSCVVRVKHYVSEGRRGMLL
jgi:hypothetical protein